MIRPLLLLCALFFTLPAPAQQPSASIQQNQQELERVQGRMQALAKQVEDERGQQDAAHQQLQDAEKRIATAASRLRRLSGQIEVQQKKIRATHDGLAQTQGHLNEQKQALAHQIRAAYMIGEGGQLRLLLNQEDAQKLGRITTYYDFLNRARTAYIGNIRSALDRLTALHDQLAQQRSRLQDIKNQQQQTLATLESTRAQRQRMVHDLDQHIAGDVGEIKQLQANEQQIKQLLQSLQSALADIPLNPGYETGPFPKLRGRLPWPVRGRLLASYGQPKAGGRLEWNGIWIAAPEGAPVRAVARGRVAYVGWLQRYGLIIILEHEDGYYTLYGHNDSVGKAAGEWVQPGETIARAGATGGYERPGVYFELRKGTEALNPSKWLGK
ncbi:MAG: murein hydrolase activator EnvC family protein [Stenotrophobium sp.]